MILFYLFIYTFTSNAVVLVDIRESEFGAWYTEGNKQKLDTYISRPATIHFETAAGLGLPVESAKQVQLVFFDADKFQYQQALFLATPAVDTEYTYKILNTTGGISIEIKYIRNKDNHLTINVFPKALDEAYWYFVPNSVVEVPASFECIEFIQDKTRKSSGWLLKPKSFTAPSLIESVIKRSKIERFTKAEDLKVTFLSGSETAGYRLLGEKKEKEGRNAYELVGPDLKNNHAGFLGELATDLYFFLHNFTKLPSKIDDGADHGWDHIFVDSLETPSTVWIVDTKFTTKSWSSSDLFSEIGKKFTQKTLNKMVARGLSHPARLISKLLLDVSGRKKLHFLGVYIRPDGLMKFPYYSQGSSTEYISIPNREEAEKDADKALKILKMVEEVGEDIEPFSPAIAPPKAVKIEKTANAGAGKEVDDSEEEDEVIAPIAPSTPALNVGTGKLVKTDRHVPKGTGDPTVFAAVESSLKLQRKNALPDPDLKENSLAIAIGNVEQTIQREGYEAKAFLEALAYKLGFTINLLPLGT